MKFSSFRASRGVTLLEVMFTMVVMLVGIAAVMTLVTHINASNRRTLTATQAQVIAERALESIASKGCTAKCANLRDLDNTRNFIWQTASGELRMTDPSPAVVARKYEVAVDVDSPVIMGSAEGGAMGHPPLNRNLGGDPSEQNNIANVRVSVSWVEPGQREPRVVVLQTRMAP
ncbi:type IV pilus modification PilV family protein [Myxococcus landrumensis]|uniref:Prepilin-type N-terminal cleavage/methylation domain-containing protein n=1 Tax=Myxococcus landrumensis TaxID=2813577 RepID=A0ABX7MYR1_9BACT|nr:prepilin-type N-terminal cleavage/methylation domain-containing protein [Myxococcus landrumus]QSQ11597.1 prepilin-type N-terminal cleavage/methylation domain-containing protein [Myxococcus landrumus]